MLHYASNIQQNLRYSTMTNPSNQLIMTPLINNDDYGTMIRGGNSQQQYLLQPQQQLQQQHFNLINANNNQPQNRLSMESIGKILKQL